MSFLQERPWRLKYTPDTTTNIVQEFYVPLLGAAVRYDRLTGFFDAAALALAARGIEGLVQNDGRMRMVVGCTLGSDEITAIQHGRALREVVTERLVAMPLTPSGADMEQALELLAWLVWKGLLTLKVGIPCDQHRRPITDPALFHEKSGIAEDAAGDSVAFSGSLNETAAGWTRNWESLNVFCSWRDPERVREEAENFGRLWNDKARRALVMDIPEAVKADLLRFKPLDGLPIRLAPQPAVQPEPEPELEPEPEPEPELVAAPTALPLASADLRRSVWSAIRMAPSAKPGGLWVGQATSATTPWPHQEKAFLRLDTPWPPKLLIADEVGLGKTIEAGLLLRQAWLSGQAKRILILAPKNLCKQWQIELREKFNLNWPIYDGHKLVQYPSRCLADNFEHRVDRTEWYRAPVVIASSHLMRRKPFNKMLLEDAEPWDLVIVDEAHHGRHKAAGTAQEGGPNALLSLMRGLTHRTQGLVLLTATPMQVHPVELYDLLALLDLPAAWTRGEFLWFFENIKDPSPSPDAFERMSVLFRATEATYGKVVAETVRTKFQIDSKLRVEKILRKLRDKATIERRMLETADRKLALKIMRMYTPVGNLISRHTRELLRKYQRTGVLKVQIAERDVQDSFIDLAPTERELYEEVEDYIQKTFNMAAPTKARTAIGFVMTIYRRRLASSFFALRKTLQSHLDSLHAADKTQIAHDALDGRDEDDLLDDERDEEEAVRLVEQAQALLTETGAIQRLIERIDRLPVDSKYLHLAADLHALRAEGYKQAMVFTQFTDTMLFLRSELAKDRSLRLMCFSGRGGEVRNPDGSWRQIDRDQVKRRFKNGEADILLCTDAAAEGLNFQFCGALINYDMPWNPMKVEQRIGRIDRLGQLYATIRIRNYHYEDTVETNVYQALRTRISLFETVVGGLQPILARMSSLIAAAVLSGNDREIMAAAQQTSLDDGGFDLDALLDTDGLNVQKERPALTLDDLDRVLQMPELLPPGFEVGHMGGAVREYWFRKPGMKDAVRITTDPAYYEANSESVELWSPGSPTFPTEEEMPTGEEVTATLSELLAR